MLVIPSDEALGAEKPGEPAARTISIFRHSFLTRGWPIWARYAITALIVLATLGFALLLPQNIPGAPFLPFVLAIIICSALFDHGSGIAAVLLSAGLAKWYLIPPTGTLDIARTDDIAGFSLFLAIGLVTAAIIEALHRVARDLIKANKRLVASEGDKDLLLQEASHRFKNELTMLTALLRLQSRHLEDQAARAALGSTADRVQILGRVHERLRRVNQTAAVDTREFITSLCEDLKVALVGLRPIALKVQVENHLLGQERAVPMGLIMNEFLTNTLKYAFPDERPGTVTVRFFREDEQFQLSVCDDGVGIVPDRPPDGSGLGQRLVRSMVLQLEGTLELKPDAGSPGTVATVRFPVAANRDQR
jgi:two-component system, sensor histidine kinase PdtaS